MQIYDFQHDSALFILKNDTEELMKAIKEYKRIKRHEKDELFLADFIK